MVRLQGDHDRTILFLPVGYGRTGFHYRRRKLMAECHFRKNGFISFMIKPGVKIDPQIPQ